MFSKCLELVSQGLSSAIGFFNKLVDDIGFGAYLLPAFLVVWLVSRLILPVVGSSASDMVKDVKKEQKSAKDTKLF